MEKEKLSSEQFILLSWLATTCHNAKQKDKKDDYQVGRWHGIISGLEAACRILNVPFTYVYDISINGNFAGYQNMNRLTEIRHF
jgi:hypothetical protein